MAETSKRNLTLLIFDSMAAPVILFNVIGDVMYANPAALQLPGRPAEVLKKTPQIQAIIKDVMMARVRLPAQLEVSIGSEKSQTFSGLFVEGPSGVDVAFLPAMAAAGARSESQADGVQLDSPDTLKLLQQVLMPSVQKANKALGGLEPSRLSADIRQALQELTDRLGMLTDLTQALGDELKKFDDILVIPELVRSVCNDLKAVADKFQIQLIIEDSERELPHIFGNARLIRRAVHEVLHHTMTTAREAVAHMEWMQLRLSFMTTGSFLNLGIQSRGAVSRSEIQHQARQLEHGAKPAPASNPFGQYIGIPLVQRIMELHGGVLKMSDEARGSFVLFEFPTGAPAKPAAELAILQAKAYAADLSKLVERLRRAKP